MSAGTFHLSKFEIDEIFERLLHIDGKAEIVDGRIVTESESGAWPAIVSGHIAISLNKLAVRNNLHFVVGGKATFRVDLPNRQSFSPDAAYFIGPSPMMGPFEGAPVFAVEVRSIGDYGQRAEELIAAKRADYFAAGTQVVWDVDLLSNDVVKVYRMASPETCVIYRPGDVADAEPAVSGWSVAVNDILPDDWEPPKT